MIADCIPLAIYDPKNKVIALIHCSWKNLDKLIIPKVIKKIVKEFGSASKDLIVEFGPSLGPCCYKNLPELKQKDDPKWRPYIFKAADKTYTIDIWGVTQNQLLLSGLLEKNINNPKICTYYSHEYFSYRKMRVEGTEDNFRFAAVLGMKK